MTRVDPPSPGSHGDEGMFQVFGLFPNGWWVKLRDKCSGNSREVDYSDQQCVFTWCTCTENIIVFVG